jgi:uncharacterized protein DUF1572
LNSAAYLRDVTRTFKNYKALGDAAIAQVSNNDLHTLVDPDSNSLSIMIKHVAGNLKSRFDDFLTTDGEKPARNRDAEFEMSEQASREQILALWNGAWAIALASVEALAPEDLDRTVYIRGEAFLVFEALSRSATHTSYHVGQIVFLAKHFAGAEWKSLSIPKGQSAQYRTGTFKQDIIRSH